MFEWTEDPTGDVAHRPWPLPLAPWIMGQRWNNLLFAHWPVDTEMLRALVPESLPLDLYEQSAWVSITPFYLSHARLHGVPAIPWVSEFPELNVRTYVTLDDKPGVYFFSLDAGSTLAVTGARTIYHLPYFDAEMSVHEAEGGTFLYHSHRTDSRGRPADFEARYRPTGDVYFSEPGSLDHWLTERYCLYAVDSSEQVHRAEIHHHKWPLQPAELEVSVNTMATAAGITLPERPPRLSFTRQLDVVAWAPETVKGEG